jgi:hypothetical protein
VPPHERASVSLGAGVGESIPHELLQGVEVRVHALRMAWHRASEKLIVMIQIIS